jgi:hypothetical protein
MNAQAIEQKAGGGSAGGANRRFSEMPNTNGNIGKLGAVRREHVEAALVVPAARALPDVGCLDCRRRRLRSVISIVASRRWT